MRPQSEPLMLASGHDDPRVVHALEVYMEALEVGCPPDRDTFLKEHAEVAEPLAECLDGLEFLHRASTAKIPERLGDYRLIRELGRGGMGIVYEAEQLSTQRRVAVKVLRTDSLNPNDLKRFQHEAQTASLLNHPHIVPVYAVGSVRGVHYIAMQYISGKSLAEWCDTSDSDEPAPTSSSRSASEIDLLDPSVTVTWVGSLRHLEASGDANRIRVIVDLALQAADALAHAHSLGIIHRDIKPANLLLDDQLQLWVADFGLAQVPGQTRLTHSHAMVGTLRYMSPEQVDTRRGIDHRVDLYGLGATLYELLTRRPVHDTSERGELIGHILNEEPIPLRRLDPQIPRDLETIVLKLLAKQPSERYPSARDLADDLQRFRSGKPIQATRPTLLDRLFRWSGEHRRTTLLMLMMLSIVIALQAGNQYKLLHERQQTQAEQQHVRELLDDVLRNLEEQVLDREPNLEPVQHRLLQDVLAHYRRLSASSGSSPEDRLAMAHAYRRIADIEMRLGHAQESAQAFLSAESSLEQCGSSPAAQRERATCANNHGNLARITGQYDEAMTLYRRAIQHWDGLQSPQDRSGRAGAENNLGLVLQTLGKLADAQVAFRNARTQFAQLSLEFPDDVRYRDETARSCHNLANTLAAAGQTESAEALYRDALALRIAIRQQRPADAMQRFAVAQTQCELANLLLRSDRTAEAGQLLQQSNTTRELLAEMYPQVMLYQFERAVGQRSLAMWHQKCGRFNRAEAGFQQAIALLQPIADGAVIASARTELARTWCAQVACLLAQGRTPEARTALLQAHAILNDVPGGTAFDQETKAYCEELTTLLRRTTNANGAPLP